MTIQEAIDKISYEPQRKIIQFMYDNPWLTSSEISELMGVKQVEVANCVNRSVSRYGFNIEYKTDVHGGGGFYRRFKISGIGKGEKKCVDVKIDRKYTQDELDNVLSSVKESGTEQTLTMLHFFDDYVTVEELAEFAGVSRAAAKARLQKLSNSKVNASIHRIEDNGLYKLKLIDVVERGEPKAKSKQKHPAINELEKRQKMAESIINSVFR